VSARPNKIKGQKYIKAFIRKNARKALIWNEGVAIELNVFYGRLLQHQLERPLSHFKRPG